MKILSVFSLILLGYAFTGAASTATTVCTHTKAECYQLCKSPVTEPVKNADLCPADAIGGPWACTCSVPGSSFPSEPNAPAGFHFMGCMYQEGCNSQLCSGRAFRFYYDSEYCGGYTIACFCSDR